MPCSTSTSMPPGFANVSNLCLSKSILSRVVVRCCSCSTEVDPNCVKNDKGDYEIIINTSACDKQGMSSACSSQNPGNLPAPSNSACHSACDCNSNFSLSHQQVPAPPSSLCATKGPPSSTGSGRLHHMEMQCSATTLNPLACPAYT